MLVPMGSGGMSLEVFSFQRYHKFIFVTIEGELI